MNIAKAIIGKITYKPIILGNKSNYLFVNDNCKIKDGYAAFISNKYSENTKNQSIVYGVKNLDYLKDGDIVSIEPDGKINLLYQKQSDHNSLFITEKCNCSCVMCPQPRTNASHNTISMNLKLISLMDKKTKSLGLTGGEPTLIGGALIDIINECKKKLPHTSLNLLTNGIMLEDFEYAKKLAMVEHHDLLIDIPLYADTDIEHNKIIGSNGFYKTIQALYNLALFEQKVGIRVVIHKLTYQRLPHLAEFIYHNFPFVFQIAFMEMETTGLAKKNIEELWIDPYEYNQELKKAVVYLQQRCMNVSIYNAQLCILDKKLWPFARKSISLWKNIYLEECRDCIYCNDCGGFFETSLKKHSEYIKALKS